ncbi:hypothetical protein DAI22_07g282250 [Oryza sativa Japonica Group]|nr:hypothetical protein DAI22_07g282250 [Oryza sativa Japonica Group]
MAYFSRLPAGCPCRGQLLTMDHRLEENASGGEVAPEFGWPSWVLARWPVPIKIHWL